MKGTEKKNVSRILFSVAMGILLTILMVSTALWKDDSIECKVIYNFFEEIDEAPYLFVADATKEYNLMPRTPETDTYQTVWTWFEMNYAIPYEVFPAKQFSLELLENDGQAEVLSIEFYNHGYQVAKFSAEEIASLFTVEDAEIQIGANAIKYTGNQGKITLQATDNLLDEIFNYKKNNTGLYFNSVFAGCLTMILVYFVLNRKVTVCSKVTVLKKKDIIFAIALSIIFVLVCLMAFFSKHYSHPDETVTRMAIDYYMAQWQVPDLQSSWTAGTSSIYGLSRLSERNIYYLLAGKIGWYCREFLGIAAYYRVFNVLLMGSMLCMCWKRREKHTWMVLALCINPQLWYIYSYATSDAWDWFCGFVMLYMLLEYKDRLYQSQSMVRLSILCAGYGIIFAMLFLAKSNYYILFGIAFVDFLLELFQQKGKVLRGFLVYGCILILTFGIKTGIEKAPTLKQEPVTQGQIETVISENVDSEYNYLEEFEQYLVLTPKDAGVSLVDLLWNYGDPPMLVILFASFIGCYMWMGLYSGKIYIILMGLLYVALVVNMIYVAWKNRKDQINQNIKMIWGYLVCVIAVIITILYCWTVTYQPQGRYLLGLLLVLGHIYSQCKGIENNKIMNKIMMVGFLASCYSFAVYGLLKMLLSGYMLIG